MNRQFVRLYGSIAGTIAVDSLRGYGPGGAGLVFLDVDYNDGAGPTTVALEGPATLELERALREARLEVTEQALFASRRVVDVPEEMEILNSQGLKASRLEAAAKQGLLGGPARRLHRQGRGRFG